jgi:hypothetical protein
MSGKIEYSISPNRPIDHGSGMLTILVHQTEQWSPDQLYGIGWIGSLYA